MESISKLYRAFKKTPKVFTDSRKAASGGIFFALKGDRFDGNDFALSAVGEGAALAVVDRKELAGANDCFYVENVLETLQQLANFHRKQLKIPVLAITGSNGKTTSKELVYAVLKEKYKVLATSGNYNNHIGVPLTLLEIDQQHEIAIIEMGANHPGEIDFLCRIAEPDYGLITNVGKAHLEGFGSFEGVKKTKGELYNYIEKHGKGVFINTGNSHLNEMAQKNSMQFSYGSDDADLPGENVSGGLLAVAKARFPKGWLYLKSKLTGSYNLENILAAARIGMHFKIDPLLIQKGIESYSPSNQRSQLLKKGNTDFLVDCYNANPTSTLAALENFIQLNKDNKLVVLGDMLELGKDSPKEHQNIVDFIENSELREIYLVGDEFYKTLTSDKFLKFHKVEDLRNKLSPSHLQNKFVLLKASRGIQLEKLLT